MILVAKNTTEPRKIAEATDVGTTMIPKNAPLCESERNFRSYVDQSTEFSLCIAFRNSASLYS